MDNATYLKRLSRMAHEHPFMLEFMNSWEEYVAVQRNLRAIAQDVGVTILGKQS